MTGIAKAVAVAGMLTLCATPAWSQATIDFETNGGHGSVHGTSIDWVSFEYYLAAVPNGAATVSGGPGCLFYVCNLGVEGATTPGGQLVMTFDNPLSSFGFGAAASTSISGTMNV